MLTFYNSKPKVGIDVSAITDDSNLGRPFRSDLDFIMNYVNFVYSST